ncbi:MULTISPECIES: hypothetical protein [unclassified Serratia (in: enterobacteria)]|uniref:hypothetical protein n=1 Tax=unclassified Serratia (in: enterobacteria) TaxID=2647522 RepID=UPI002ED05700|nr:hypothetical protein [Serratia sp. C2(2)]MEE4447138.1 hypothetical protein [Serratia sp. C2(1)]
MELAVFYFLMASQPVSGSALNFTSGKNTMIDYSLYGLDDKDVELYREQIYNLVGKSVVQVLLSNKTITKQSILAHLIKEIERQPEDYCQKLHRAAIEVIGVNGR